MDSPVRGLAERTELQSVAGSVRLLQRAGEYFPHTHGAALRSRLRETQQLINRLAGESHGVLWSWRPQREYLTVDRHFYDSKMYWALHQVRKTQGIESQESVPVPDFDVPFAQTSCFQKKKVGRFQGEAHVHMLHKLL